MGNIKISGDLSPIFGFTGTLAGFFEKMASPQSMTQVVNAMVNAHEAEFNIYADHTALHDKKRLHHVYEWGAFGKGGAIDPADRLWTFVSTGQGGSKNLFYRFRASRKTVPITDLPGDTRKQVHVFTWKAAVMEAGAPLTVNPSADKGLLVFPSSLHGSQGKTLNDDMQMTPNPVHVLHPGGESKGAFAELWESYWGKAADAITVADVIKPSNEYMAEKFPQLFAKIPKSRVYTTSGTTVNNGAYQKMYNEGRAAATDMLSGYLRAARQREALAGG